MLDELKAKLEKKNADADAAATAALTAAAAHEGGKKKKAVPAEAVAAAGKTGNTAVARCLKYSGEVALAVA